MVRIRHKSINEHLQEFVAEYREAGEPWPADNRMLAAWLLKTGRWVPPRKSQIDILAPMISRALREEYFTDARNRRVRKKHAIRESKLLPNGEYQQHALWVDIEDAPKPMMLKAFQQRRGNVLGDCRQLKVDVDYYNEFRNTNEPIPMLFDFTDDLLELEQPTEYDGLGPE